MAVYVVYAERFDLARMAEYAIFLFRDNALKEFKALTDMGCEPVIREYADKETFWAMQDKARDTK